VDGSLRVVRNGIGVVEQALVELPGIKGMWSLRKTFMDAHDAFLVLTFSGETRVLGTNAGAWVGGGAGQRGPAACAWAAVRCRWVGWSAGLCLCGGAALLCAHLAVPSMSCCSISLASVVLPLLYCR
jgi:hypothetical protein